MSTTPTGCNFSARLGKPTPASAPTHIEEALTGTLGRTFVKILRVLIGYSTLLLCYNGEMTRSPRTLAVSCAQSLQVPSWSARPCKCILDCST